VESTTNRPRVLVRRRNRLSLNWIDFLVIAAIILTFAAIVTTTLGRARASTHNSAASEVSSEISQLQDEPGQIRDTSLIKARIGIARLNNK
jgi:hypothetical protein